MDSDHSPHSLSNLAYIESYISFNIGERQGDTEGEIEGDKVSVRRETE